MLYLLLLIFALCKGLLAFGAGAAVAGLAYLLGKLIHFNVWAFLRWGVAALLVALFAVLRLNELADTLPTDTTGYANIQFWCDLIAYLLAVLLLLACGIVISTVKGAAKVGWFGWKKLHSAEPAEPSPPPLPPPGA